MGILAIRNMKILKPKVKGHQRLCFSEQYLGNLLYKEPGLIPMEEIQRPPIDVIIWGGKLPNGKDFDLLGIDRKGGITIIETKLGKSPDMKKKVFSQLQRYTNELRRINYDYLDRLIKDSEGKDLFNLMKAKHIKLGKHQFRDKIDKNLENGAILQLIVTDNVGQYSEFLKRIMENKNRLFYAVELACFQYGKSEIIHSRIFPLVKLELPEKNENTFKDSVTIHCDKKIQEFILKLYKSKKTENTGK